MQGTEETRGFAAIVGHEDVVSHMQNAIKMNKISHAYIIGGDKGAGKKMLAGAFAQTLQCRERGDAAEPCGVCPSCKKAASGNHPDIIYVRHDKPNTVSVDDVRGQLVGDVAIRPYESPYKIYIVDDASKMTPQAQNAILKTIEEPPAYAIILLLAENPDALLPTITSRCVTLRLKPVEESRVREYLMNRMHVPDYQAEIEASFAQGNIGKAKMIAGSSKFMTMVENAVRLMKKSNRLDIAEMTETVKAMSADKNSVYDVLEIFNLWFHDVLLFKATREVDSLIFKEEINAVKERARYSSYEGLQKIIDGIATAGERLRANVNFDLTMELLFLTIREN